jgi:hypothetical protein
MAQALIICDQMIEEAKTGKKSLIGIFNNIFSATFPAQHPKMCVYASLTNGRGPGSVELRCVNVETGQTLFKFGGGIVFSDPNEVVEMNFNLNLVPLDAPGLHSLELWFEDELLLEKRFSVTKVDR